MMVMVWCRGRRVAMEREVILGGRELAGLVGARYEVGAGVGCVWGTGGARGKGRRVLGRWEVSSRGRRGRRGREGRRWGEGGGARDRKGNRKGYPAPRMVILAMVADEAWASAGEVGLSV